MKTTLIKMLSLAACVALFTSTAVAEEAETPASIDGIKTVTAQEAAELQKGGAVIIDPRRKLEYKEEHIKGSISVVYKGDSENKVGFDHSGDKFKIEKKVADKSTAVIPYCNGVKCWKSYKAAVKAKALGYTNVYWMRGGIPEWKAAGLPVE